jgi:hypothetical protein
VSPQDSFFLNADDVLMLRHLELAVRDLGEGLDDVLADVLLGNVTVVVDKDFQHHHGVLTDFVEHVENEFLVVEAGVARVEELQEDCFNEDQNHAFEVFAEVEEQTEEDRCDQREDSLLVADTVSEQSVTEGVLNHIDESFLGQKRLLRLFQDS